MTEEAKAIVSFGHLKRGDRLQVDIHDPHVAGLIRGGYLTIIWKERADGPVDNPDDPDGSDTVPADRVDSGGTRGAQEEEIDGPRGPEPRVGDPDSASAGRAADAQDG